MRSSCHPSFGAELLKHGKRFSAKFPRRSREGGWARAPSGVLIGGSSPTFLLLPYHFYSPRAPALVRFYHTEVKKPCAGGVGDGYAHTDFLLLTLRGSFLPRPIWQGELIQFLAIYKILMDFHEFHMIFFAGFGGTTDDSLNQLAATRLLRGHF